MKEIKKGDIVYLNGKVNNVNPSLQGMRGVVAGYAWEGSALIVKFFESRENVPKGEACKVDKILLSLVEGAELTPWKWEE